MSSRQGPHSPQGPRGTRTTAPSRAVDAAAARDRLEAARPYVLSLFRVAVGLLFACHGFGALFGVVGPAAGPQAETVDPWSWPHGYAAVIQLVGGGLIVLGYGSRSAALISSGSMAYAYFDVHAPQGLIPLDNGGESAAFYCWAFLLLVCAGPGPLSLERLLRSASGKRPRTVAAAPD